LFKVSSTLGRPLLYFHEVQIGSGQSCGLPTSVRKQAAKSTQSSARPWRMKGEHWQPFPTATAPGHLQEGPAAYSISGSMRMEQDSAEKTAPILLSDLLGG
jgi:hypothetical protein